MKKFRSALSIFLAVLMLLGTLGIFVYADSTAPKDGASRAECASVMMQMKRVLSD